MMNWKKNEEITIVIDDLGNNGEGIGHVDGYTLFVKGALPGEKVRVRIMKQKKNYGYARLLQIVTPSPDRQNPLCPALPACGGCTLQHLSYGKQLAYKEKKVLDCLERIGGLDLSGAEWLPVLGMEEPWHYRNKAQFPVRGDKSSRPVTGFFAGHSHHLVPVDACCIQHPVINEVVEYILAFMRDFHIPAYEEERHTGLVRHIYVRRGHHTGQIMVCLVVNGSSLPYAEELTARLRKIGGMTSICLNINKKRTNVILGPQMLPLWGPLYIEDSIGEIRFRISPQSFYQVNPVQTERLYETALSFAELKGNETVWDLYCGIGTISLLFARELERKGEDAADTPVGKVCGVEIVPEAVENAKENARINGIANAAFYCGAAETVVPELVSQRKEKVDVVVLDPPRKGCDAALLDTVVQMAPERIVYVSCDPATLARDVKALGEKGYEVKKVRACDMFPQWGHVETVCLLSKLHADHHIEVELQMDELDLTAAESKATYEEIKDYVLEHSGLKVSSLYVAQIKRKCGIIERENYNKPELEDVKQPQCPPEKEEAIIESLRYFKMI